MDLFQLDFENENKVLLREFSIENYRNIGEKVTYFVNKNGLVFTGESGVGKTTRIEALLWLLTGKLFDGSSNLLQQYIMPKNANEDTVLSVSAKFQVGDEIFIFEKKLGKALTYYVNGTPKKTLKDYQQAIYRAFGMEDVADLIARETKLLAKVDLMMLFTVLDFFPTLDNKTLRELVLLVGGDVKVSDLEMSEALRVNLKSKNFDIDELKKEIKLHLKGDRNSKGLHSRKEDLVSQLKVYDNVLQQSLTNTDVETSRSRIKEIQKEIAKLELQLAKSDDEISMQFIDKIIPLEIKLKSIQMEKQGQQNEEVKNMEEELLELRNQYADLSKQIGEEQLKVESTKQTISFKESQIDVIKNKGRSVLQDKKNTQITCPKCQHVFENHHDRDFDNELKNLKQEALQLEQDIKDLTKSEFDLLKNIEKLTFERDEIKIKGKTLGENIETRKQTGLVVSTDDLISKDEQDTIEQINVLKNAKNEALLNGSVLKTKIRTQIENLNQEYETHFTRIAQEKNIQEAKQKHEELSNAISGLQKKINDFEQLESETKILEETWLRKIDENVKNAFGENIRFKMFEENASNENIAPTCEMYVKDGFGNWVNAINGVNTGHMVPRLVEFLTIVKHKLGIRDGLLLIDFFESIGNEPLKELMSYGQQVISTQVVRNQNELKTEEL